MADVPWMELAGWVWLVGALALLGYGAVSWFRLRRRVDASICLGGAVYLCDAIDTPFLLGILHPRIYLPSSLEEGQRKNVLAHEWAHLARRDHWWKPLGFVLLAVYWFDPFLWLAYGLFCRDIELACDERVVRGMAPDEIRSYSETLLACTMSRRMLGAYPLAFGEGDVKERIRSILEDRKPAFWLTAAAAAACVIAGVCFLTDPPRASMEWARKLRVEDVACIELCVMPQTEDRQYKIMDREETAQAVSLINGSRGRWVRSPGPLSGGTQMLTVTLMDGTRHTVCNEGNVYLKIDDDSYQAGYAWLEAWPFSEGDGPIPEGFWERADTDAELLGTADLDGDGEAEQIRYAETVPQESYRLSVERSNGTELWSADLGLPHAGWISYFLYQDSGMTALLRYAPVVYQGNASYSYELFTLEGGRENVRAKGGVDTLLSPDTDDRWPPETRAFADEVRTMLENSTLLLSTLEGRLCLSGASLPADICP